MENKKQNVFSIVRLKLHSPFWLAGIFVIVGCVLGWVLVVRAVIPVKHETSVSASDTAKAVPAIPERHLDGAVVATGQENFWPLAVMIENLPVVRPQSGLGAAQVVYETLAEGGATRFMAVYDGTEQLPEIGPVRSARPYYVDWALEYDALYAHAGGSPGALIEIAGRKIRAINGIGAGSKFFWRNRSQAAPHNLYTKTENLLSARSELVKPEEAPKYQTWEFKDELPEGERGRPDKPLTVNFSGLAFQAGWEYHRDTNTYFRSTAGVTQVDRLTNAAIQAKNIIVQFVPKENLLPEKGRIGLEVTGTGRALVFSNGQVTAGQWKRPTLFRRTLLFDSNNAPIALNRGTTWVEVVPGDRSVVY